ncbi:MAG: hypothetical protein PHG79_09730 [Methanosarcina sp.]|nr:hypothetical protein [Methanosarcina sp.]MDD4522872.1 hypothetical protein [Methanosarcina sp.]
MRQKSLSDRSIGYEFSGIENELLKRDNIGFVRFDGRSKNKFYLDPSPFYPYPLDEVYIVDGCPVPPRRKLIRILTHDTDEVKTDTVGIQAKRSLYCSRQIIKYVHSWEEVNPNRIYRPQMIDHAEYINFFGDAFSSRFNPDMIDPVAHTMAIYTVSSPIIGSNNKGGINSSINYGNDNDLWNKFTTLMNVIHPEFKNTRSTHFYKYGKKEEILNPVASEEVSLAFDNPKRLVVQMPISLVQMKLKDSYLQKLNYDHLLPMMIGHNIDSLLFTPDLPPHLNKFIEHKIYELKEHTEQSEFISYNQDIGMALPKVSASIARLFFEPEITKDHIKQALDTWFESVEHSFFNESRSMHRTDVKRWGKHGTKELYKWLLDNYGLNVLILIKEIYEKKPFPEYMLDELIPELLNKGLAYAPDPDHIKLLELSNQEWKYEYL